MSSHADDAGVDHRGTKRLHESPHVRVRKRQATSWPVVNRDAQKKRVAHELITVAPCDRAPSRLIDAACDEILGKGWYTKSRELVRSVYGRCSRVCSMSEVSGRLTTLLVDGLDRHGVDLSSYLEGIGITRAMLLNPQHRVQWETFTELLERIERACGDSDCLQTFFLRGVRDRTSHPFAPIAATFVGAADVYEVIARWGMTREVGVASASFEELGPRHRRLTVRIDRRRVGSLPFFRFLLGVVKGVPRLVGLPESEVSFTATPHEGVYEIILPRPTSVAEPVPDVTFFSNAVAATKEGERMSDPTNDRGPFSQAEEDRRTADPATFRVVPPPSTSASRHRPATSSQVTAGRILVIDDEPAFRTTLKMLLDAHGFEVTVTDTGTKGLSLALDPPPFDVILCDLMMPGMTGMDLHAELERERPEVARRLVFLTGGAFTARASRFLSDIENPHVEKPFELQHLLETIARAKAQHE